MIVDKAIEQYAIEHTQHEPELLQRLIKETYETMSVPHMITGRLEGRFLKFLVEMSQAKSILEIGMFTGYSALSMAEGLPADGKLITCDIDPKAQAIAQHYFDESPHGGKIEIKMGPALDTISSLPHDLDLVFIDADKGNYLNYYEAVMPKLNVGGLIIVDNTLWSGKVLDPQDNSTKVIDELNQRLFDDSRVENLLLTVRDGVHIARKL